MTELARDLDKGTSTPRYFVQVFKGDDRIASFVEDNPIPVPDRGDTIDLSRGTPAETGDIDYDRIGRFVVEDLRYDYTLIKNMEMLQDGDSVPDELATAVNIYVREESD